MRCKLALKVAWQIAMHVRLSNVCVCMSTSWSERYRRYQCVDCWFVVEETQKFLSICRREESTRESRGKSFTNIRSYQNWADAWLASDKGSCFEQEKLLPLHEEDVWHSLSITLKALSLRPFAVRSSSSSISTQLVPRCLRVRSFVIYGFFRCLRLKPWPNGPASSRKWTQVELA